MNEEPFIYKHFKSEDTQLNALQLAYGILRGHDVSPVTLEQKYGLNRGSLDKIQRGDMIKRQPERYYKQFLLALNDLRLTAISKGCQEDADLIASEILDVALVAVDIATDDEIKARDKAKKRKMMFGV